MPVMVSLCAHDALFTSSLFVYNDNVICLFQERLEFILGSSSTRQASCLNYCSRTQ